MLKTASSGTAVNLAAPGPIGGTTPSTGAFTSVTASSGSTVTGGLVADTVAVGKTLETTGAVLQAANTVDLPAISNNLYYSGGWKYARNSANAASFIASDTTNAININVAPANAGGAGAAAAPIVSFRFTATGDTLNVGGGALGYGTGSGGTVTQLTSKATAVTLNTPSGVITMNNAALLTATTVLFQVLNTRVLANDVIAISIGAFTGNGYSYNAWVFSVSAGSFYIALRNISAGSLSDAVTINYVILRCSTA